ncbi:MAG: hypothetical protein FJZ57_05610 [Chlamydiae bacterium]|nr:hypothetical protein [Chlamydiota bacterium]
MTSTETKNPNSFRTYDMKNNFLYTGLTAIMNAGNTLQWQELADANSVTVDAQIENNIYSGCNSVLSTDTSNITSADTSSTDSQAKLQQYQAQYQYDSTCAQTYENEADAATQAAQQAVSQDGTNIQNQTSLSSALFSVMSNMSSMISHPL